MSRIAYFLGLALLAQQAAFRVDVNLQQVRFSVRDGGNAAIGSLQAEDFIVEENGARQEAVSLRHDAETPVSFGILMSSDIAMTYPALLGPWAVIDAEKAVVRELLRQMKPDDDIALMTFGDDRSLIVRQDFTNSIPKLESALEDISPCCDDMQRYDLPAALDQASRKLRTSKYRDRALIVISRGNWVNTNSVVGNSNRYPLIPSEVKEVSDAYELPIYFFNVAGEYRHHPVTMKPPVTFVELGFQRLLEFWTNPSSEGSGGRAFHFDMNGLFSQKLLSRLRSFIELVNLDLRSRYLLTYYSAAPAASPRTVHIRPVSPDYRVHLIRSPLQVGDSPDVSQGPGTTILSRRTPESNAGGGLFSDADFVTVPPGEFLMGCAQTDPGCFPTDYGIARGDLISPNAMRLNPWRVRFRRGFEIGKYEVTQAQWQSVMGTSPSYFRGPSRPVESISWEDAQEFLKRMNARRDGYRYRLPSEEEWEYVARTGKSGHYEGELDVVAWYVENSGGWTHPVGGREPNAWGVYDMYGNVFEWVQDENRDYPVDFTRLGAGPGPTFIPGPPTRRIRGGSWLSTAVFSRTSFRMGLPPDSKRSTIGFRVVREKR